jgi:hypothetical protein
MHDFEHRKIPFAFDYTEQSFGFPIFQVPGQRLGLFEGIAFLYRIGQAYTFFVVQVIIKAPDALKVAVYSFGFQALSLQRIDELKYTLASGFFDRNQQPYYKMLKVIHVISYRSG